MQPVHFAAFNIRTGRNSKKSTREVIKLDSDYGLPTGAPDNLFV